MNLAMWKEVLEVLKAVWILCENENGIKNISSDGVRSFVVGVTLGTKHEQTCSYDLFVDTRPTITNYVRDTVRHRLYQLRNLLAEPWHLLWAYCLLAQQVLEIPSLSRQIFHYCKTTRFGLGRVFLNLVQVEMCGDSTLRPAAARGGAMVAIHMLNSSAPLILRFSNAASNDVTNVDRESAIEVSELCIQFVFWWSKCAKLICLQQIWKCIWKQSNTSFSVDKCGDLSEVGSGSEWNRYYWKRLLGHERWREDWVWSSGVAIALWCFL